MTAPPWTSLPVRGFRSRAGLNTPLQADTPSNFRHTKVLIALVMISFPLVLIGSRSFYVRDFAVFGYPLAQFHKAALWDGWFPLWNPFNFCGVPHLAQWNTLMLYPGSWLYLLLPLPWSLNLHCLLHLLLGGIGMARLAASMTRCEESAIVAGVAHAFGGLTLTALMWPNNIAALGLLPWVILQTLKATDEGGRALPVAVLIGSCQMLTGAPEIILVTWILTGALLVGAPGRSVSPKVTAGRLITIITLISLVAAAQLLPFFELLGFADRPGRGDASGWSASPSCWVNFLIPGYQTVATDSGYPINHYQKWTLSFYPGMVVMVCAAFAIGRRQSRALLLACLALIGLALASGHYSTAYRWLAGFLPLDLMRFPVKFVLFPATALPLLAAMGLDRLRCLSISGKHLCAVGAGMILLFGLAVFLDQTSNAARPERSGKWIEASLRGGFLTGALLLLWVRHRLGRRTPWLLVGMLWTDLHWHQPGIIDTVPASTFATGPLPETRPPQRLHHTRAAWSALYAVGSTNPADDLRLHLHARTALLNLLNRESKVGGFLSLTSPWANDVLGQVDANDWRRVNDRMADFVGVRRLGRWNDGVVWEDRASPAPLITSGQRPFIASASAQLDELLKPEFDPFLQVCLDPVATDRLTREPAAAEITLEYFSPEEIRFKNRASAPSLAVIAQSWYPAWQATVNGEPAPLLRANLLFQAVALPAGDSTVTLRYEDRYFRWGLALSVLGLMLTALLWRNTSAGPANDHPTGIGEGQRPVLGE